MDIERAKELLKNIKYISYNEPHVSNRCITRFMNKEEIKKYISNTDALVLAYKLKARYSDEEKYELYFKISSNKTLKLYALFKNNEMHILTIIVRLRKWQNMIKQI